MAISKKAKKGIVTVTVLAVLAAGGFVAYQAFLRPRGPILPVVDTMTLERTELKNTIDVTGVVESVNSKKVYAQLSYEIEALNVAVGDTVQEGDILCQLSTKALEDSIAQKNAAIYKTQTNANFNLTEAQKDLANAQAVLDKDLNTNLLNAQAGVRSAQYTLDLRSIELRDKRDTLKEGRENADSDDIIETYKNAERTAQMAYDEAKANLEDAKVKLKAAEEDIKRQMEGYESKIVSARNALDLTGDWLALEQLKEDLINCAVKAPVSGVITGVYVEEGAKPSGLMFVIEDTQSLKISTKIKEFDIGSVELQNPVTIKSDATGDDIFQGRLSKIAPTSVKNAQGNSASEADIEFAAEVAVTGNPERLKIGMKTRMSIIYEEKNRVFAVPYDAIGTNADGAEIIYIAKTDELGVITAHEVVVTTGMETDFDVEISGTELAEGDMVILDIEGLTDGAQVMFAADFPEGMVVMGGMPGGMAGGPMPGGGRAVAVRMG